MDYYEVRIYTSESGVEPLSNALIIGGYESFSIDDTETAREILSQKKIILHCFSIQNDILKNILI